MNPNVDLSAREQEVAGLLLQGKSNKQIALALAISERTVEFHLRNLYTKLQVRSRTEAVLSLGKSTGSRPAESTVAGTAEDTHNDGQPILPWRLSMKNLLYGTVLVLLITFLVLALVMANIPAAPAKTLPSPMVGITRAPASATPGPTPTLTVSARQRIQEKFRELAAVYNQNVEAEKRNGKTKLTKDSRSGEDLLVFEGESYNTIYLLFTDFSQQANQLSDLYVQAYRDEANPTPFPTQASTQQAKSYYEMLLEQADQLCSPQAYAGDPNAVLIYDPNQQKYRELVLSDAASRCTVYGQMIEEWRVAPMLAKVNKDADRMLIRQIAGKPDLQLVFQSIDTLANAPWQNAAIYTDETGTDYYVDVDTARLVQIEPHAPSHPDIAAGDRKSLDELRGIARQFAQTNSPRLGELQSFLAYQEGGKGDMSFFTWTYSSKDWSDTDWAMMPPFLQVGVLANGQIYTYINTLDLFK